MASPSAPTCVVTATRSRVLIRSPHLPQGALYPGCPLHDWVRHKAQPGCPLEACMRPNGGLDAPGRALQSFLRFYSVLPGEGAVEDCRVREIRAHADAGDRDEAPDSGVRQVVELVADDLSDLGFHLARAPAHSLTN